MKKSLDKFKTKTINNRTVLIDYTGNEESCKIPDYITEIGAWAFAGCFSLKNIEIPKSITKIGEYAFTDSKSLKTIKIPDSVTEIAIGVFYGCMSLESKPNIYKAFSLHDGHLICHNYMFSIGEWSDEIEPKLCEQGYHFCTNIFDIFNYYYGEYGKDFVIGICEVGEKIIPSYTNSKCVTNKIKPVKILSLKEVIDIMNSK